MITWMFDSTSFLLLAELIYSQMESLALQTNIFSKNICALINDINIQNWELVNLVFIFHLQIEKSDRRLLLVVSLVFQFNRNVTPMVTCWSYCSQWGGVKVIWGDSGSLCSHCHEVCRLGSSDEKQNFRTPAVVAGPSPVTTAVLNNQSGVQFKPDGVNCETEWSYYLTSYLNNAFHLTKILQLFFVPSVAVANFFLTKLDVCKLVYICMCCMWWFLSPPFGRGVSVWDQFVFSGLLMIPSDSLPVIQRAQIFTCT